MEIIGNELYAMLKSLFCRQSRNSQDLRDGEQRNQTTVHCNGDELQCLELNPSSAAS